ncbi:MAG: DUF3299 domain-containing protein [Bacteroidota bacterium]
MMPEFVVNKSTFCAIFIFLFLSPLLRAQDTDPWDILADTEFSQQYFEEEQASFLAPTFGPLPKSFEGKPFTITGFLIPLDPGNEEYILSKYPYASCFFCGGAGPESVVELKFPEGIVPRNYQLDEYISFKGTLILNSTDIFRMNFILEDAVELN